MSRMRRSLVIVTVLFAALACRQPVTRPGEYLIDFTLEDQFGRTTTQADLAGAVSLVVVADRAARDQATAWGAEARNRWADALANQRLVLLRIAHLGPYPKALKPIVKGQLPKDPSQPVLMDWSGAFASAYELEGGNVLVLVFDAEGTLIGKRSGAEPASESGRALLEQVARAHLS